MIDAWLTCPPPACLRALTVVSIAAVIALGLTALQERPFAGDVRLPPGPLEEVARLPVQPAQ